MTPATLEVTTYVSTKFRSGTTKVGFSRFSRFTSNDSRITAIWTRTSRFTMNNRTLQWIFCIHPYPHAMDKQS